MTFITIADFVADGLADNFAVPFPFIAEPHVIVTVDDTVVARTFVAPQIIQLPVTPNAGQIVRVRRQTPIANLLVIINARGSVRSDELNTVSTQLLFLIQEALDASLDFQNTLLDRTIELSISGNLLPAGEQSPPFVVGQALQLPAGLEGTRFVTFNPPLTGADDFTFAIFRNGETEIGDVSINSEGVATINFPTAVVFGRGDAISIVNTGTADISDIGGTFQGVLI